MIVFCDFDGTITTCDTNDFIIINHYGKEYYDNLEKRMIEEKNHNEQLRNVLVNMAYSMDEILDKLKSINNLIDETFFDFYQTCKRANFDFYVISSGFKQISH